MLWRFLQLTCWLGAAVALTGCREAASPAAREFTVTGEMVELRAGGSSALIRHDPIPGYMVAMTMPFRVRDTNELAGLRSGDQVAFQFHVTSTESWIDQVRRSGRAPQAPTPDAGPAPAAPATNAPPLLADLIADMVFTNEFGREVRWGDFHGQALGLTFLFTRCPVPDYCPRLAKNFAAATHKLKALPGAPTNWHLLAITIDPAFDTPAVLRNYATFHGADPTRWNLLVTSKPDTVRLARLFGLTYEPMAGTIEHDFRTVIVDAAGTVRAVWPIGGDTTDQLVAELVQAARATNAPVSPPP